LPEYVTAGIGALILGLILGPVLIPRLRKLHFGQYIRSDGPRRHLIKSGTPTMGGILFLIILPVTQAAVRNADPRSLAVLLAAVGFGMIGMTDDLLKIRHRQSEGLSPWQKMAAQILFSLIFAALVYRLTGVRHVTLPAGGGPFYLGMWYIPAMAFVMVGTVNAVNLTDGVDGLAAGVTFIVALAYTLLFRAWNLDGLTKLAGALAGVCLGFLFFNLHPARLFMGDTGAFCLGGAVGALAVLSDTVVLLPLLGVVYVLEAGSDILQVAYFKWTRGRRLLRMAPLHHHFELKGWSEEKIAVVFWLGSALAALLFLWIELGR
jgi:phospho-N-acetylmuramoyl-pentapeptide-transferase